MTPMPDNHTPSDRTKLFHGEGLCKHFVQQRVLVDINFSVYPGEILGIIGPNGAGKTTLMECLAGLLPLSSGTLHWQNQKITPQQLNQCLFYLPDGILPYAEQRVGQVVTFFHHLFAAEEQQLQQLLERLGLQLLLEKRVHSLSIGYRKRLLLLIGLLSPQPLLLLDEPFDGFDLRQSLGIMQLLRETLSGRTLLLSIHQLTEAEKICDRFLLLNCGKVAAIGSLEQLQEQAGVAAGGLEEAFLALI